MARALVILDGNGPLPLRATFQSPTDGDVVFAISGTAWTQNAASLIGCTLTLDGQLIGKPAICFANQNANHQALRTTFILYSGLKSGDHAIVVQALNGQTVTDINDYFQVVMFY